MKALTRTNLGTPPKWLDVQQINGVYSISGQGVVVEEPAHDDVPRTSWLAGWYAVEELATSTYARGQVAAAARAARAEAHR